jgi:hypothetical protein
MMKINIMNKSGYVEFVITGIFDAQAAINHIDDYYSVSCAARALWNVKGCDLSALTPNQLPDMARAAARSQKYRGEGVKTAVCVSKQTDQVLFKVYGAWHEIASDLPLQIFYNQDLAVKWLLE